MRGDLKLGRRLPFTAEQVINWGGGMICRATVRMYRADPLDSTGSWTRGMAESVWLPSACAGIRCPGPRRTPYSPSRLWHRFTKGRYRTPPERTRNRGFQQSRTEGGVDTKAASHSTLS
ncbi:hypothetical protein SBA6_990011 [Candidatus Sulfopaludibacter sp. SbA6]|nr:hypothetical protein SBA6_990011 [Candidatus Sulfopaludibacter sp. SbA6]